MKPERVAELRIDALNAKYSGKEFTIPASETMEILDLAMNQLEPMVTPEMWKNLGRIEALAERTTSPVSQMTDEQTNTPTWMQALPKGDEAGQFVGAAIVYTEDRMISYGHACGIVAELALLQSMKNLAQAIWRSHYRDDSPDFQLLDDCHGVLSQIDNMVTGLVRAPSPDEGRDNPESIRHDRKFDAELDYWVNCVSAKNGRTIKAYGSLISYLDRRQAAAVEQARLDGYNKGVSDMLARIESAEQDLAAAAPHAQAPAEQQESIRHAGVSRNIG